MADGAFIMYFVANLSTTHAAFLHENLAAHHLQHKRPPALIHESVEMRIFEAIAGELTSLGCIPRTINGTSDHIHILTTLHAAMATMDVVKQIKGAISHWINAENIVPGKFAWQTGYAAYSVSESAVKQVENYIAKQKEHHRKRTFTEEYEEFIRLYGAQQD